MSLGKRCASPIKGKRAKTKRAKTRNSTKDLADLRSSRSPACLSRSVTPELNVSRYNLTHGAIASVGEQWETNY